MSIRDFGCRSDRTASLPRGGPDTDPGPPVDTNEHPTPEDSRWGESRTTKETETGTDREKDGDRSRREKTKKKETTLLIRLVGQSCFY